MVSALFNRRGGGEPSGITPTEHYIPEREQEIPWHQLTGLELMRRLVFNARQGDPWTGTVYAKDRQPPAGSVTDAEADSMRDYEPPSRRSSPMAAADDEPPYEPISRRSTPAGPSARGRGAATRGRQNWTQGGAIDMVRAALEPDEFGGDDTAETMITESGRDRPVDAEVGAPATRRQTADYGGAIERLLNAQPDQGDFWRSVSRAGFTLAAQDTDILTAMGKAGLAYSDSMDKAVESARARQARGLGFAIQDAQMAETERRNAVTEAETARSHRAAEGTSRGHLDVARGNLARAQQQLGFEMQKYKEGRPDAQARILADIQLRKAQADAQRELARMRRTYGPAHAKPIEGVDDEGNIIFKDPYEGSVVRATDEEGKPVKAGAKPGKAPTSMRERVAKMIEESEGPDAALAYLKGEKRIDPAAAERIATGIVNAENKMGTWTPEQIRARRNEALTELAGKSGGAAPGKAPAKASADAPATPKTKAEYDALPSGALYVDPRTGDTKKKK